MKEMLEKRKEKKPFKEYLNKIYPLGINEPRFIRGKTLTINWERVEITRISQIRAWWILKNRLKIKGWKRHWVKIRIGI